MPRPRQPVKQSLRQGPRARARRHDWIDERSAALARLIAEHARQDASVFDKARRRIRERLASPGANRNPSLKEWERILTSFSPDEILAILVEDSERGARLRQSSPFVGVLSRAERNAVFAHYETL